MSQPGDPDEKDPNEQRGSTRDQTEQDGTAALPPEILEKLPQEQRQQIEQFFGAAMSMTMGMGNPIAAKVTSQHITDIIALSSREVDHDYSDRKHSRLVLSVAGGVFLLILVTFAAFLAYIRSTELLLDLVKVLGGFIGGFGGGFGFAYWRRR